ncbi:hypothetical protein BT93_E1007 [Corymbia citriodora subsp. variegata]|nr:hypothetical protein BT93_E1007 [Corymbia citriodora subsp. variegata]
MGFGGSWSVPAKACGSCKSAAATVFCRADAAFLCPGCDFRLHGAAKLSARHERVWVCEVCEQAPAAVTCKADAAALCVTCDADIHSANPLARRHERVPVEPFLGATESTKAASAFSFLALPSKTGSADTCAGGGFGGACQNEELEAASWLFPHSTGVSANKLVEGMDVKVAPGGGGDVFFNDMETLLDFEYGSNSMDRFQGSATDSLVPVQTKPVPAPVVHPPSENCFDIDFCRSKLTSFSYLSHSVSSSSLDVGVVPEGNSMSDISYPFVQSMSGNSTDQSMTNSAATTTTANQATPMSGMDREARVLRYREKRKNRKFEKTIRYASRKAYAETRPRIKGRFAKRTEIESEVDNIYGTASAAFMADSRYGVVPSF